MVRDMYDLILHPAWLHPKAVRHCVILLAGRFAMRKCG